MDVYALFTDGTAEKIIIDSFPKKEGENGLIIRTTISSHNLKESAVNSITNANIVLEKYCGNLPNNIAVCIYGFSENVLGSSADLAFAFSFVSHLLENGQVLIDGPIPFRIAATGMIDERLNVRSVKGLKSKILAAIENKAEIIFYPQENQRDFEQMLEDDSEFCKIARNITTIPVKSLEEAFIKLGVIQNVNSSTSRHAFSKRKVILCLVPVLVFLLVITFLLSSIVIPDKSEHTPLVNEKVSGLSRDKTTPLTAERIAQQRSEEQQAPTVQQTPTVHSMPSFTPTQTPVTNDQKILPSIKKQHLEEPTLGITDVRQSPEPTKAYPEVVNYFGNSASNLINSGFASLQGEWIYYTNNLDVGFYKVRLDGLEKSVINNDFATYINVSGEYAYYINKNNNSLYKIKTDGTDLRRLNDDDFEMIDVVGNWIYYICLSDNKIYKIDKNGLDRTPLCNNFLSETSSLDFNYTCKSLCVYGNSIYFYAEFDTQKESGIYKMAIDGSKKTCILNDKCTMVTVDEDSIYYISSVDMCLYKIKLDGSSKRRIVADSLKTFNISSGWVYFSNDKGIYKIHTDGDFSIKICDDTTDKIVVLSDFIYYFNSNDGNRMYRIRTNGKDKLRVE